MGPLLNVHRKLDGAIIAVQPALLERVEPLGQSPNHDGSKLFMAGGGSPIQVKESVQAVAAGVAVAIEWQQTRGINAAMQVKQAQAGDNGFPAFQIDPNKLRTPGA